MIAIVDYKMGNLRSVQKGFEHAGVADIVVTDDPAVLSAADGIVLPGVGAFRDASANLKASGLWDIIVSRVDDGEPFLGICLGMQLLATVGLEDGEWEGLGIVPGSCERLPGGVKIPHIGWNTVEYPRESRLFDGIAPETAFYFVHSYRLRPDDASCIIGRTEYGVPFAAAVESGSAYAVQFHPEKSSTTGLKLLANFGSIVTERGTR
ncbi:imidazole glycerol phosphate synthase subunit HisH [Bosea sp. (in: a-proteobacteria)]|uniref:imidazole glycerol phosphate synthase subunit HisH n=1 Tax=Bosea sp. (in: a-proteobacteria) TaxID=1871050 RepID=UPI002737778E|nr:imidazole glycerol phosphate synthase subunit HisH [Bosea sp. (in: a-proteobacteria)]MDP3407219.1 imidazole glycerol phosphate synthase subunit HisH [Bosea sp. (in: a-proteobacteria)]